MNSELQRDIARKLADNEPDGYENACQRFARPAEECDGIQSTATLQREIERLRARVAQLEADLVSTRWQKVGAESDNAILKSQSARCRDVVFDGTDGACEAWWRGHDQAVASVCQRVSTILNGMDTGAGVCGEPWESVRRRLLMLAALSKLATTQKPE